MRWERGADKMRDKMTRVNVLHTARLRAWQMATIPMPEPTYYLQTTVRLGERGPQYVVETDLVGGDARVWPALLPRRRLMRRCGRRDAILAAVARALPHTRPAASGDDEERMTR